MSMLDKFRKGAQKAGMQASAFIKDGSSKLANESHHFAQGFTLPGEAEKAAKILASFLGKFVPENASPEGRFDTLTRVIFSGSRSSRIRPEQYPQGRFATCERYDHLELA